MIAPQAPGRDGPVDPASFDALLQSAATWVLIAGLAWGLLLVTAALVERLSRGRLPALRWTGCPRRARPLLLALAGLVVLLPGSALAAGPTDGRVAPGGSGDGAAATGRVLSVPSRPGALGAPVPAPTATTRAAAPLRLTVRPGDSLWSLAEAHLGPRAGAAEVADLVARLHHRNLAVVGPDPDLLRPGQQLRFPATPPPQEAP